MNKIRLLSIMPYNALIPIVKRIADHHPEIELVGNVVGLIDTGAELVLDYQESTYDAIISRGATKRAIERVTGKPVFDIPISYFDLIRIISLIKNYDGKPVIVCSGNIAEYIKSLSGFFENNYETVVYDAMDDLASVVSNLKDAGYTLVIGDAAAVAFASAAGLQTMLISSGPESVEQCFVEIIRAFGHFNSIRFKSMLFEEYLSSRDEQLIVFNPDKTIAYSNNHFLPASQFLKHCPDPDDCFSSAEPISSNFTLNGAYYAAECSVSSDKYVFCRIFRSPIQALGTRSRYKSIQTFSSDEISATYDESHSFTSNLVNRVMFEFQQTIISGKPILITSESGLEKTRLACMMFLRLSNPGTPLTTINCASFSSKEMKYLLNDITSPLLSLNCFVLFRDVQLLDPVLFDELIVGLHSFIYSVKCHILFTYELSYHTNDKNLDRYNINTLKNKLDCSEIPLKPLRSSTPDIRNYSILYIKQKQEEGTSNVIGIEPEAADILLEYSWPRNFNQLQHVLDEAIISSRTPWISAANIRRILQNEENELLHTGGKNTINLDGTLDELTKEIVSKVLAEEKQNRTKAAQRLGISRTTLWRILQS